MMNPTHKKPERPIEHVFREDFRYNHDNPYHDRLKSFDDFVFRDDEGEKHKGKWSQDVFKNEYPVAVEIGSGFGEFMIEYCQNNPEINFLGMDHRFKRSFHVAKKLEKLTNPNFRYLRARGERLSFLFAPQELSSVFYFFPDPWPKNRHNKKRLFQKPFLDSCHQCLKTGGKVFVKTDHDGYFEWMLNELKNEDRFLLEFQTFDLYQEAPEHFLASFQTKFEKIFLKQKTKIKAMVLVKK